METYMTVAKSCCSSSLDANSITKMLPGKRCGTAVKYEASEAPTPTDQDQDSASSSSPQLSCRTSLRLRRSQCSGSKASLNLDTGAAAAAQNQPPPVIKTAKRKSARLSAAQQNNGKKMSSNRPSSTDLSQEEFVSFPSTPTSTCGGTTFSALESRSHQGRARRSYVADSDSDDDDRPYEALRDMRGREETGHLLGPDLSQLQSSDLTDFDEDIDGDPVTPNFEFDPANMDFLTSVPGQAFDKAEEIARKVWEAGWTVVHHNHLPKWLRDNDFLIKGHRPPLNSFWACFKSIFRIHTETGNIWTHLLGFIAFLGVTVYFLSRPSIEVQWQEKAVFSAFFVGAILCLGFSFLFHTVFCHSERVGRLFNKLDYCGIALLTMGSFVPWLYYSFYCRLEPKITYLILIFVLGTGCIVVSMWDKFAEPKFRPVRAGMFIGLGLSGVIPAMHYVITDGFYEAYKYASLHWLVLMAFLYIAGAVIYAVRIPERIWPGKFDIWCQSHQIFHVFVVAAAFVHFHGISEIATYRLSFGDCIEEAIE